MFFQHCINVDHQDIGRSVFATPCLHVWNISSNILFDIVLYVKKAFPDVVFNFHRRIATSRDVLRLVVVETKVEQEHAFD